MTPTVSTGRSRPQISVMKLEKQEVLEWDGVAYKKAWAERDK